MRPKRRVARRIVYIAVVLGAVSLFLGLRGCTTTYPNRNPIGSVFPTVVGQSLEKQRVELPADYAGEPLVFLVGYKQRTQFDIDRWVMGLMQAGVEARMVELPTIPGLVPSMASGWIDDGMRSGIPREDWAAVVTLYGKAATPVAEFTGTERGQLTRIIVLDAEGTVIWFDDEGYSVRKALEVAALVAAPPEPQQ
jgi:hypothetical protein